MRTLQIRSLLCAVLACSALAATASAQEKSRALLNTLEVQQLVTRADPGDHARLAAHFSALADRYTAEARQHTSMSQSFIGNPNRNLGTNMSVHCKQLADFNTKSATTLRELATYHQGLAGGAAVTRPAGGSQFEGGAGASLPTEQALNSMAANAGTPADHRLLEEYFLTLAKRDTAEANEHVALAQTFRGTRIAHVAVQHDRLAELSRDSAKEATAAAEMHKQMASLAP